MNDHVDLFNAKTQLNFLLTSFENKLEFLMDPLNSVSPVSLSYLNKKQKFSIRNAFLEKKIDIEGKILFLKSELSDVSSFDQLHTFLFQYNKLKKYYFLVEKIWTHFSLSYRTH